MPTQEEMDRNRGLTTYDNFLRKKQRSDYEERVDNLIPAQDELQLLKSYLSFGDITSTKERRRVKKRIDGLEQAINAESAKIEELRPLPPSSPSSTLPSIEERERASGLNLAGNDPTSGRNIDIPTIDERERDSGLVNTTSGRLGTDGTDDETLIVAPQQEDQFGTIGIVVIINNRPHAATVIGQMGDVV
tara:strand:+ start:415 stop:984 length:570 start_codon:yes stop_codon:yes gene_type:complete